MKMAVTIYRRPDNSPAYPRLVLGTALGDASGFSHGVPAWAFAEPGIVIACAPEWEHAVGEFLTQHCGGRAASVKHAHSGEFAQASGPRGAAHQQGEGKEAV
jgi:hypothetical protein